MSFNFSQFKGIHNVTNGPERVWIGRNWSIEVPVGFTYTVDPEETGEGPSGGYLLHIQKSEDCDFSEPYSSDFNVLLYQRIELISCNCDNMMDKELIESIHDLPSHLLHNYLLFRCSSDLLVLYSIVEQTEEVSRYNFQVAVRGCNLVYTGQFSCYSGSVTERHKDILQWLETIDVLTEKERLAFESYSGKSIAKIPTLFSSQTAAIDQGVRISIPQGFHAETDQSIIGNSRRLVIVPEDYPFSADPMDAPIALSIQAGVAENCPSKEELVDRYFELFCNTGNAFCKGYAVNMYKHSDKAFSISQSLLINAAAAAKTISVLFTKDKLYTIHIIINYNDHDYEQTLADWDIDHFSKAWLGRIQVDGETPIDYPTRNDSKKDEFLATQGQSIAAPSEYDLADTTPAESHYIPSAHQDTSIKWAKAKEKDCEIDFLGTLKEYRGKAKSLILPDTISTIGEDAFSCNDNITSVLIPEGVDTIEKGAFGYCGNLKNVYLPNSLSRLGDQAFYLCKSLTNIVIPEGCYRIGEDCFTFCENLKDIYVPDSVSIIEKDAFWTSNDNTIIHTEPGSEAESFAIENDIKYDYRPAPDLSPIISAAYASPAPKTTATSKAPAAAKSGSKPVENDGSVSNPADFKIDGKGVLTKYKGKAANVQVPSGVKKIAFEAFKGNKYMVSLSISEGVTDIDNFAFNKCKKLNTICFPETLESISDFVFNECSALVSIDIPEQVKKIGPYAFSDCSSLDSVVLPSGLTSLSDKVFLNCKSLDTITIPDNVTSLGKGVFYGCKSLVNVSIPETMKTIGEDAFSQCESLTAVTLSPSLEEIGASAFWGCKKLQQIIIPEGVKNLRIGKTAFTLCDNISFSLPESLASIEPKDALAGYFVDKLIVHKGSFAEQYAIENNIKYETIQPEMKKEEEPQIGLDTLFNALS